MADSFRSLGKITVQKRPHSVQGVLNVRQAHKTFNIDEGSSCLINAFDTRKPTATNITVEKALMMGMAELKTKLSSAEMFPDATLSKRSCLLLTIATDEEAYANISTDHCKEAQELLDIAATLPNKFAKTLLARASSVIRDKNAGIPTQDFIKYFMTKIELFDEMEYLLMYVHSYLLTNRSKVNLKKVVTTCTDSYVRSNLLSAEPDFTIMHRHEAKRSFACVGSELKNNTFACLTKPKTFIESVLAASFNKLRFPNVGLFVVPAIICQGTRVSISWFAMTNEYLDKLSHGKVAGIVPVIESGWYDLLKDNEKAQALQLFAGLRTYLEDVKVKPEDSYKHAVPQRLLHVWKEKAIEENENARAQIVQLFDAQYGTFLSTN
jgi:hypothetical protein